MVRSMLIDTDTASDDAVALIMALQAPDLSVLAITTVAGNVGVAQASRNALYVAELCESPVLVYLGAAAPLSRTAIPADWFHGSDGLGNHDYPAPRRNVEPGHAVDAIIGTVNANPGLTLVTLGPLTNVALALAAQPSIAAKVGRCVLMGGNPCCEGNVTPAAEYNIWCDPEAAQIVLRSGMAVDLVGWHLCRGEAVLNAADIAHVNSIGTPLAQFAIESNSTAMEAYRQQTGETGISLPDPVAMAIALDPSICTSRSRHAIQIETGSALTRGMTVVDRLNVTGDERNRDLWKAAPTADICWTLDVPRWKQSLYAALARGVTR
ncbi:MAG: nucleoside hydrolase [Candidatus Solibacter sp.]